MRKFLFSTILASLPALGAGAAMAQSSGGFTTYGFIEAGQGYFSGSSSSTSYYFGDFGGSYGLGNFGGVDAGVDLGVLGFGSFDSGSSNQPPTVLGGLTLGYGSNKVTIGAPRAAYDLAGLPFAQSAGNGPVSAELYLYGLSFNDFSRAVVGSSGQSYGLRYDGAFSGAHVAASWNRITFGGTSLDTYGAAATYQMGNIDFYGGTESTKGGGATRRQSTLGVAYDFGRGNAGLALSYGNGLFLVTGDTTQVRAFADYDVTDRLTLSADAFGLDISGSKTHAYGIEADYTVFSHASVVAGYTHIDGISSISNDITSIALNWSF